MKEPMEATSVMTGQSLPAQLSRPKAITMLPISRNHAWKMTSPSEIAPDGIGR